MDSIFYIYCQRAKIYLCLGVSVLLLSGAALAQSLSPASEDLFKAVYDDDLARTQISIADGADVEALNSWGVNAIDLAVNRGHFDIAHFLLRMRDIQRKQPKNTPAPPTIAATPITPIQPAPAPIQGETAFQVEEVIAPPPSLPKGPDPFKTTPVTTTGLPIIGTVRGPEGDQQIIDPNVKIAVDDTFQNKISTPKKQVAEMEPAPTPGPVPKQVAPKKQEAVEFKQVSEKVDDLPKEEGDAWDKIRNFLNLDTSRPESAPEPKPITETSPAPRPVPVMKISSVAYQIQIVAVRTEERATSEWARLKKKHGDLLGGYSLNVVRADLGADKGIFYRLRVGPIASEDVAKSLCQNLSKRKVSCLIVRPGN